jgi:hypothetical protein
MRDDVTAGLKSVHPRCPRWWATMPRERCPFAVGVLARICGEPLFARYLVERRTRSR